MLGLYYRIWADAIMRAKAQPANLYNWPVGTMLFMTVPMSLNFVLIMTILEKYVFDSYLYEIELAFLPARISNVISFIVLFILPCAFVNYFLIFYKQRYKNLLKKYPYKNGKLFLSYFLISMSLPLVLLIVGIATGQIGIEW